MTIVVVTPPAAEPLTIAEVMAHCRIDASQQEPAPGAITAALASPAAPGNVDNGVHRYLATFTTATGETQAGTVSAAVTVADKTANGKVALTGIPVGGSLVTGRKLYRTAANGAVYLLLATLADNVATTYTDNIADSALGAGAPATNTTEDGFLGMLITSARLAAEAELRRALITQTLELYLDQFPGQSRRWFEINQGRSFDRHEYEILLPPLAPIPTPVTSITYIDTDGATQTLDPVNYLVDSKSMPARIAPAYGIFWPFSRYQNNSVIIRFVAGYGPAASDVPQCVKNWMLMRIKTLWDNRSEVSVDTRITMVQMPEEFLDGLLDPERVSARV